MTIGAVRPIEGNCWVCKTAPPPDTLFKTCAKCKWAFYCSPACQKKDWPSHKPSCASLALRSVTCEGCHISPPKGTLFCACAKCQSAFYCTVECQRKAWPEHKKICTTAATKDVAMHGVAESKVASQDPEPTLTGYCRFFNIWEDLYRRKLTGPGKVIDLLGAGLQEINGKFHCPQLSEALCFWESTTIYCVDSNPTVLEAIKIMDHRQAVDRIKDTFDLNGKSPDVSDQMDEVLRFLLRTGERTSVVKTKWFKMGEDDPQLLPQADVIIATFSLMYPMIELFKKDPEARLDFFIGYTARLKKGGILYVDTDCLEFLLQDPKIMDDTTIKKQTCLGPENMQRCVAEILSRSGIELKFTFLKQNLGHQVRKRLAINQCKLSKEVYSAVETVDMFAFERMS